MRKNFSEILDTKGGDQNFKFGVGKKKGGTQIFQKSKGGGTRLSPTVDDENNNLRGAVDTQVTMQNVELILWVGLERSSLTLRCKDMHTFSNLQI